MLKIKLNYCTKELNVNKACVVAIPQPLSLNLVEIKTDSLIYSFEGNH